MELLFRVTRAGISIQIADTDENRNVFVLFALHLWGFGRRTVIEFYKAEELDQLYFHIQLPFFRINNDTRLEVVTSGTSTWKQQASVTVGKVFGRTIYRLPKGMRKVQ